MPNKNSRIGTVEEVAHFLTHRADELNERERKILELHYGIGQSKTSSLVEIGRELHLSSWRVRDIEDAAVWRLRRTGPPVLKLPDQPAQPARKVKK